MVQSSAIEELNSDDEVDQKKIPSLHGNSDYSPEVTKMLKGWKDGPVFGPGCNKVMDMPDARKLDTDDGRTEITWSELREKYGYGKPAPNLKLVGDISQRDKNNWQYQKHVKLRDRDGTEHAVFFYVDDPYHWTYDDMEVGSYMQINSPRLHRFMDGQDGMRLEEERLVAKVVKSGLTDHKRMDYANLMRENGNRKYKEEKYEDAVEFYETAINHISGTSFHDNQDLKPAARELEVKCHNNIAQSAAQLKNYEGAMTHCRKALAINPKSAKAYFRLGICTAARGNDSEATEHFNKALEYAPGDPSVSAAAIKKELAKSTHEKVGQKSVLKSMYSGFLGGKKRFGVKKGMSALSGGQLSHLPSLFNFRDVTGGKNVFGRKLQKHVLYRSSAVSSASTSDLNTLCSEYGVKTVIDMRSESERVDSAKYENKQFNKEFGRVSVKEDEADGRGGEMIETAVSAAGSDKLELKTIKEGRVCFDVDILDTLWSELMSTQEQIVNLGLRTMCQTERADIHRLVCTQGRMDVGEMLRCVLDDCGPAIKYVLGLVADPANHPVVLCCHHGKDLTGLLVLLILGCIGVDEDAIVEDFMQSLTDVSDDARKELSASLVRKGIPVEHAHTSLDTVQELLDFLDGRYGGPKGYLQYQGFSDAQQTELKTVLLRE